MSVLAAIAVLAVLIVVHELGHFLAARSQGIHVNRFSIGFGPILWKYQGTRTEYALRGIPLGGFVGFPDEDPDSPIPPNDPDLMKNRPIFDRAIVISAGVIANLIFAYVLLVGEVGLVGIPEGFQYQPGVLVPQVIQDVNSAAQEAGIKNGDVILEVNGQPLPTFQELSTSNQLQSIIESSPNQSLKLKVQRGDGVLFTTVTPRLEQDGTGRIVVGMEDVRSAAQEADIKDGDVILEVDGQPISPFKELSKQLQRIIESSPNQSLKFKIQRGDGVVFTAVTPRPEEDGKGKIGVRLTSNGYVIRRHVKGIGEALTAAADQYQRSCLMILTGFGQLLSNFKETANQVAGPVAIVAMGADIANSDAANLFQFAALISINLAVINILPLPALDGGQLVFLMVEGLRGKPVPDRIQEGVMQSGLVLLLGLGVLLIVRDTANLEWVKQLLQQ